MHGGGGLRGRYFRVDAPHATSGEEDPPLLAQVQRYGRLAAIGLVLLVVVSGTLVYGYWMQAHMRTVYESRVDIETPKKTAAIDKWHAICDPSTVPMCDDMRNGTIVSAVCLIDNGASAWVSTPGQRQAAIEDCALLRRNATLDIEHVALGEAFNELCAHAPLLNWLCDGCVFRDRSATKTSWVWSLGQFVIKSWSNSGVVWFASGVSLLTSFAPGIAWLMRWSTNNSLSRLVKDIRMGSVAGETPGGMAPLEGMRVDAVTAAAYAAAALAAAGGDDYGMQKKSS